MNDPIDQLKEWWGNAEVPTAHTLPREGDRIIFRYNSEWYEVATAADDAEECDLFAGMRILSRAPRPAWHDAAAVMADTPGRPERRVFIRYDEPGWWGDADSSYETDELAHVTPLIEAKVTDEMVERARDYMSINTGQTHTHKAIRGVLTAALGLEAE